MLYFPLWKKISITGVCLLFVIMAIPSLLPESYRNSLPEFLPENAVNLGLDLQGGSHLLLEVDYAAYEREQITNLADDIRRILREAKIFYVGLAAQGKTVKFSLRENHAASNNKANDNEKTDENADKKVTENATEKSDRNSDIIKLLRDKNPDIEVSRNANEYLVTFNDSWHKSSRQRVIEQSLEIVQRRIDETGTKEPIIQRQGEERIVVQVPGEADPARVKSLLGKTAKMTFHLLAENIAPGDAAPVGVRMIAGDGEDKNIYPVISRVELSGDLLVDANASYSSETGEPVVAFRFNNVGARKFGEITAANLGKPFAIVLDNKVITAPVIQSAILGGSGIISGNFSAESAHDLALLLRAGALPAPLTIMEERSVGPSLGADSIRSGTIASIIGIALVVAFMLIFYGLFGMFANIAMIVNAFMTIALLSLFDATLTLPGIAGIVLTVGMAVDANVLIYERMREEVRNGKSPLAAVEDGFKLAFGTIFDSHITTLSAALILYQFGTGTVKGFAVTLSIGIICSLFTAVLVTRLMVATYMLKKRPKILPI